MSSIASLAEGVGRLKNSMMASSSVGAGASTKPAPTLVALDLEDDDTNSKTEEPELDEYFLAKYDLQPVSPVISRSKRRTSASQVAGSSVNELNRDGSHLGKDAHTENKSSTSGLGSSTLTNVAADLGVGIERVTVLSTFPLNKTILQTRHRRDPLASRLIAHITSMSRCVHQRQH
jgi:hypothetical protein